MMLIFSVYAYDLDDGYALQVEVPEGVPEDVVKKIANEVAERLHEAEFPTEQ